MVNIDLQEIDLKNGTFTDDMLLLKLNEDETSPDFVGEITVEQY